MGGKEKLLSEIANVLRRDSLQMTTAAGSGHPTSCLSCAEIFSVLFFDIMKYDPSNPDNPENDEFILSKGHAAPIYYSALYHAGCISEELMNLRKFGSPLEGHPLPSNSLKWVKVATGSLGQGLSIGCGIALAAKMSKRSYRTYVLMGDGESAEGSVSEAIAFASKYKLNNLCVIIDINRLGQSGETMFGHNIKSYKKIFDAYGWKTICVDGHNIKQLLKAFSQASKEKKTPTAILAKTIKGKGVSFIENKEGWHGKPLSRDELEKALKEIPNFSMSNIKIKKPAKEKSEKSSEIKDISTNYSLGEQVSTRQAFGNALAKLAKQSNKIIAIDGDVKNSTMSIELSKSSPRQAVECYIAEQSMIGVSLGLSKKGFNVFPSTFAAFLSRAHDQIRMAALSEANITIVGSHCGVSIGEDGPSQMGLEDIAMFRSLPNSIILYPSDAVSSEKLTYLAAVTKGLKYIRTNRPKTAVIYKNDEKFELNDYKILKYSKDDKCLIVASGITVHEALKAYEELKKNKVNVCVVDLYCIRPFNSEKLAALAKMKCGKIVVVEDHYAAGGIGEMIATAMSQHNILVECLSVKKMPHSGKPEELMSYEHIDKKAIVDAVRKILR